MNEEAKKARRDYMRRYMESYRKKFPEKVKGHTNRYWERKAKTLTDNKMDTLEQELNELKQVSSP